MKQWMVLRYAGAGDTSDRYLWSEIAPSLYNFKGWEAADAGAAFRLAVLENRNERLQSTSYRVLPLDGAVSLRVDVQLNAEEIVPESTESQGAAQK